MKLARLVLLLIPVGATVAGFAGCGATTAEEGFGAEGGATSVIVGPGGSATTSSLTFSTGTSTGTGQIAARCAADADCGGDLYCVRPIDDDLVFGGGAPGGFCTKDCTADAQCAAEGGICYQPDPDQTAGRCTLACGFGPPISSVAGLFTPLSQVKCQARDDVRCISYGISDGACVPTCGSDSQCPGGHCDPRTAMCVTTPSGGDPTGSACNPSKEVDTCAGLCVGFQTGDSMCSEPCVLGGLDVSTPACGGPAEGICAFHPTTSGAGDTGFCTPSCAFQSDCQNPSFWCFGLAPLTSVFQRGYCFAATSCATDPSICAPADGGPVYTCTDTPAGPLCLDTTFPFDADAGPFDAGAPGDGGSFDGGSLGDAGEADGSSPGYDGGGSQTPAPDGGDGG